MEDLKKAYRTSALINSAIIASLLIYLIVAEMIKIQYEPFEGFVRDLNLDPLRYALYALALVQLVVIIKIRGILMKKDTFNSMEDVIIRLSRASIITSSLCEVPAIFGLILFLLSGMSKDLYILLVWSGILFFLYFPRYSNWKKWARNVMSR
jgi:hypothetical protein